MEKVMREYNIPPEEIKRITAVDENVSKGIWFLDFLGLDESNVPRYALTQYGGVDNAIILQFSGITDDEVLAYLTKDAQQRQLEGKLPQPLLCSQTYTFAGEQYKIRNLPGVT